METAIEVGNSKAKKNRPNACLFTERQNNNYKKVKQLVPGGRGMPVTINLMSAFDCDLN